MAFVRIRSSSLLRVAIMFATAREIHTMNNTRRLIFHSPAIQQQWGAAVDLWWRRWQSPSPTERPSQRSQNQNRFKIRHRKLVRKAPDPIPGKWLKSTRIKDK
ncbi:hypothetical protein EDB86DRAFT_1491204 [Lactarius hatsudake]|nr:hypothetical protein EDB86DRAFT_1491204 [Lactarius hatsudake]